MMKVLTVFGTRPEAIKMAVLVNQLNNDPYFEHKLCVTGQHRHMLDQVLELFRLQADFDLNIMQAGQDLSDITSNVMLRIRSVFKEFRPDVLLVHGDTTTCLASTLAGFYAQIRIGHVEAGLRTGNLQSPFPEEANRTLVSRLASYHFAPTQQNVDNLLAEGIAPECIIKTGNTVIDALMEVSQHVHTFSAGLQQSKVARLIRQQEKIMLVTGHRRENFGQGFIEICQALRILAEQYPQLHIVYPVHLNPNVSKPVHSLIGNKANIHLLDPLSYTDFIFLMKNSHLVLTDSGGVQEEAPGLGKPVLVMRDTTERPEAVEAGTVKLVGANESNIVQGVSELLDNTTLYHRMSQAQNPYGDGKASGRIVNFLKSITP
jgi:UDP-N-acetylglucosamine 2-epimerase (non-hydrolysing)